MDNGVLAGATWPETKAHRVLRRDESGLSPRPVRAVHLGLGAFHRAHQAWYAELAHRAGYDWGIAAFTGRRPDEALRLAQQDGLYHLVVRSGDRDSTALVSSISAVHDGRDVASWVQTFRRPDLRFVTITVTEPGYRRATDGSLDWSDPDVRADAEELAGDPFGAVATAPFRIVQGLAARHAAGLDGLAVISCDNLASNGDVIRRVVLDAAATVDRELAGWIAATVDFPNSMVDRITPRRTENDLSLVREITGHEDAAPIVTEPFTEWVVEHSRYLDGLGLAEAGVRFVDDVAPYEQRKLLVVNGGHSLLAYAGQRRGHRTVAEAVDDPVLLEWLEAWWDEAAATLDFLPESLDAYRAATLARFRNPAIRHLLSQIANDGEHKVPIRTAPVLRTARSMGVMPDAAARIVGAWSASLRTTARAKNPAMALADAEADAHRLMGLIAPDLADDAALVVRIAEHTREQESQ